MTLVQRRPGDGERERGARGVLGPVGDVHEDPLGHAVLRGFGGLAASGRCLAEVREQQRGRDQRDRGGSVTHGPQTGSAIERICSRERSMLWTPRACSCTRATSRSSVSSRMTVPQSQETCF